MPSPFPGMDPYLEGRAWESFHAALIDEMGRQLAPKLRPKYLVRVERRLVVGAVETPSDGSGTQELYPDVSIVRGTADPSMPGQTGGEGSGGGAVATIEPPLQLATHMTARSPQRSISIVDVVERMLVASIELLSPTNKRAGGGREEYLQRRESFLAGDAHLVEIDLLRRGTRLPMRGALPAAPYFAFVSRADRRPMTGVWPITLRGPLPTIPVPLLATDADAPLELQAALTGTYDAFSYDLELDYRRPPEFPLSPEDAAWAREHLAIPRAPAPI